MDKLMRKIPPGKKPMEGSNGIVHWGVTLLLALSVSVTALAATQPEGYLPLKASELERLVSPVALYPDDLLAVVLPATAYPLQIVQASRYLAAQGNNSRQAPDDSWDESVVALLNYPEILDLLNEDLDWTAELGDAVVYQHEDVITAVMDFRERARMAGNLRSDGNQTVVVRDDGVIEIRPRDTKVIYVPYYEPERVVVYSPRPVYHYYSHAYPVYYYPYPAGYRFSVGFFWGVSSVFSIGWHSHRLHVHYRDFDDHPYYGYTYYDNSHYYRHPRVSVNYTVNYYQNSNRDRYDGYDGRRRHSDRDHQGDSTARRSQHAGNYWAPEKQQRRTATRHRREAVIDSRETRYQPAGERYSSPREDTSSNYLTARREGASARGERAEIKSRQDRGGAPVDAAVYRQALLEAKETRLREAPAAPSVRSVKQERRDRGAAQEAPRVTPAPRGQVVRQQVAVKQEHGSSHRPAKSAQATEVESAPATEARPKPEPRGRRDDEERRGRREIR